VIFCIYNIGKLAEYVSSSINELYPYVYLFFLYLEK
jgi:hypothetical protein